MMRFFSILALIFAVAIIAVTLADDGMAACQTIQSFDVCHASIH